MKVLLVSPVAKVRVSVFAVKSLLLAVSSVAIEVVTVTLWSVKLFLERDTVKLTAFPSSASADKMLNSTGVSSSVIVPKAIPFVTLRIAPLVALLKVVVKVSFFSTKES